METLNLSLIRRSGENFTVSSLSEIQYNTHLCQEFFGVSNMPKNMSPSQAMAWADKHYREVARLLENYKDVFLKCKQAYAADTKVKSLYGEG